jgi:hypothetical protein
MKRPHSGAKAADEQTQNRNKSFDIRKSKAQLLFPMMGKKGREKQRPLLDQAAICSKEK